MIPILFREISGFFSSLTGYIAIGIFLLFLGLMIWVFPDFSLLEYPYATLDPLFNLAPIIFMFLIPAITMRSFAEENQTGTLDLLITRPLSEMEIILGKYFGALVLILFSLLPTLIYYYSVYQLGSPQGNIDSGAIVGSYIGLFLLGAAFAAIGLFASVLSRNQIVGFILSSFLCFVFYWAFFYISKFPVFVGRIDDIIQKLGIDYHYTSISRGVIDSRDILYFITVILIFLLVTKLFLEKRKYDG